VAKLNTVQKIENKGEDEKTSNSIVGFDTKMMPQQCGKKIGVRLSDNDPASENKRNGRKI
jgi:hypothetical protein